MGERLDVIDVNERRKQGGEREVLKKGMGGGGFRIRMLAEEGRTRGKEKWYRRTWGESRQMIHTLKKEGNKK